MAKATKTVLRGVTLTSISTKRKRAQDAKVEVWLALKIEGLKPDEETMSILHSIEDEPLNITLASQQTKLEGV